MTIDRQAERPAVSKVRLSELTAARSDVALLLVSASILTLEVLQTKIFAYSTDPLSIYVAIAVCLLGLGASGTILAVAPPLGAERVRSVAALFSVVGAGLVLVSHFIFSLLAPNFFKVGIGALLALVALGLPYLCLGMVVAALLVARGTGIGRAYASNLAGSGLGCLIVFPILDCVGAERALVVVSALALAGAFVLARPRPATLGALCLVAVALAGAFHRAPAILEFSPEPAGQLNLVLRRLAALRREHPGEAVIPKRLFKRWDRTARVDVYGLETSIPKLKGRPTDSLFLVQDASAGSILLGIGNDLRSGRPFFEHTIYGAGYALGTPGDVLIIGLGGGPDALAALYHGASRIVGVEINAATIDVVRNEFSDYVGDPYRKPGVTIHQTDGRTYLQSTTREFDLIQMSGVDTKSVLASGALSLNENHLYTREAMGEILRHLRPAGVLAIIRFGDPDVHRLASLAIAGLRDLGEAAPHRHVLAIGQGLWRSLLVRRRPFTASEIERVLSWAAQPGSEGPDVTIPAYDLINLPLREPMSVMYSPEPRPAATTSYFQALLAGRVDEFIAAEEMLDLSAPVDDRPFFFFRLRPWRALYASLTSGSFPAWPFDILTLTRLHKLLLQLAAVSAGFILAPLVVLRARGLRAPRAGRTLGYFACLGVGFMFAEIGLIQRFVLLLGHQGYAISVVLFGLIFGASIGSLLSNRLSIISRGPITAVLAALILVIMGYAFGLGAVFQAAAKASFGERLALSLAVLVALGVLLGVPFPTALRALQSPGLPLVAWAVGVNGFFSVIGSTLAVEVAMLAGLRSLLLLAAMLYGLAILCAPIGQGTRGTADGV